MSRDQLVRLRRIAAAAPALGEDGEWLAEGINQCLASPDVTLDRALGIAPRAGQRRAATADALARRDAWLRRLARERYGHLGPSQAAAAIVDAVRNYIGRGWTHDRQSPMVPARHVGTDWEYLWHALRAREAKFPESVSGIYRILRARPDFSE